MSVSVAATAGTQNARALARIDLSAVERNCALLKEQLGQAALCAVVKANGYGHGAVECARAALAGGATWLAVATAGEASELRTAGVVARLLVMGALTADELAVALAADADVVAWSPEFIERIADLGSSFGTPRLHVKLDTGMGRLGTRDAHEARALVERIGADERLELTGFMTHFATADDRDSDFFEQQLERFGPVAEEVKRAHVNCVVHAANSAAAMRDSRAHFDMARCGIAIYGLDPFQGDPAASDLEPAMALESYLADVKTVRAGESVGYGRTWRAERNTHVAVLPIGYGDGYRRGLSNRAEVIVHARRCPVLGTVSMDNITVDVGNVANVRPGDRATLIGTQDGERILAEELAQALGTINYEITCGISARVERTYERSDGRAVR